MNIDESEIGRLFELAKSGDRDALGRLLDHLRPELCQMAKMKIGSQIRVRAAASDIAQHSCLSAVRDFDRFKGEEPADFVAWLRHIHAQNVRDVLRDHGVRQKRAISREAGVRGGLCPIDPNMATPSHEAMRGEKRAGIARVLATLPKGQREAVYLRHMEGLSLAEIAEQLERTEAAVAGLLKRGLAKLRDKLEGEDGDVPDGRG